MEDKDPLPRAPRRCQNLNLNPLRATPAAATACLRGCGGLQTKAGLAPYGATPEQMHVVEHTPADWQPVDNWWQRAWIALGVDKLLALIAADI